MACMELVNDVGTVIGHICRPHGETRVAGKRRRRFWCFQCRKRELHTLMGFYPSGLSWYGPHWWYECPTCRGDYRTFPGCG